MLHGITVLCFLSLATGNILHYLIDSYLLCPELIVSIETIADNSTDAVVLFEGISTTSLSDNL